MIEHYLSVVFFFHTQMACQSSDLISLRLLQTELWPLLSTEQNHLLFLVIQELTHPSGEGVQSQLGNAHRPSHAHTHTGEHTQQFSVQELYKGENSFVSFIQPEQLIIKQIRKCLLLVLHNGKDDNKFVLVIFNDLKKIFCNLSQIRKIE